MPLPVLIAPVVTWILREIVVKFVVFAAVFGLVAFLVPYAVGYLGGFIAPGALTAAFSGIPAGVWYFLDLFRIDYGFPLAISAMVSKFLIRRLPVIG